MQPRQQKTSYKYLSLDFRAIPGRNNAFFENYSQTLDPIWFQYDKNYHF